MGAVPTPYLRQLGQGMELVVPFGCVPVDCWWLECGRSVHETLVMLGAPRAMHREYCDPSGPCEFVEDPRGHGKSAPLGPLSGQPEKAPLSDEHSGRVDATHEPVVEAVVGDEAGGRQGGEACASCPKVARL